MLSAQRAGAGLTGTLRISFVASAAREILPSILLRFREHYPAVRLELREAMTAQQVALLANGESDLGFVIPPLQDVGNLHVELIARNRLVAALPDGHPLAAADQIALSDLSEEPWILFAARQGPGLHRIIHAACVALESYAWSRNWSVCPEGSNAQNAGGTGECPRSIAGFDPPLLVRIDIA